MRFNDMPLSHGTKDAITAMGYEDPTPIQDEAIPLMLKGIDVIGRARTGTGKTAAFGIPMVEGLRDTRSQGVVALVLVPTRELALQVSEVLRDLAAGTRLRVATAYGGTGFDKQIRALQSREPVLLVACPGRLLDLCERGIAELGGIEHLVLDEADRMLDMGFIHDMRRILKLIPRDRQTSLWSATLEGQIRNLARDFLRDPQVIEVESGPAATTLTTQFHLRVEVPRKADTLLTLLAAETPDKAVVFTRTKHLAKRMAEKLGKNGWAAVALQGNMSQSQRERAMMAFRKGDARILVATDVAARGLDVPDISHVINFDLPTVAEDYVHRIGRTGRNGRTGRAFTFVQSDQVREARTIEHVAGSGMQAYALEVGQPVPKGPDAPYQPPTIQASPSRGRSAPRRPGQGQRSHGGRGQASRGQVRQGHGPRSSRPSYGRR